MNSLSLGTGMPPALIFIIGALFIPLLRGRVKSAFMLLLPLAAFYVLLTVPEGMHWQFRLLHYDLTLGRVDRLSRVFGYIFTLISFISLIYALKVDDDLQYVSGLCYAGGALGVTFAGDLFTLYIFWEIMAVASTFLILARRTKAAQGAAFRYILVHVLGGLCLLAGIVLYVHRTGTIAFGHMALAGADTWLIFIGIAVNAAIPPLHPWLQDAYPEATVAGAVFLSAFTTKSAVYVMARVFAGTEILIWLGALMTVIPIFYATLENDIRRVLAYSLVNQVGFMMCAIGIGTQLALNGAVAHAFCHILYKALLFMAAGSVLQMTGKIRCTELGGLYKTMPLTCFFCIIGAASIAAFPLFSGFVSKSMIVSAAAYGHLAVVWLMLQFASAGIFPYVKVPYFAFFGHDSGIRAEEPPFNMRVAMGMAAFLCVLIGVFPQPLYHILPYPVEYAPYTVVHVVDKLQLLMFGLLAFCLLMLSGYYPAEMRSIHLDVDWFYRKGARVLYRLMDQGLNRLNAVCDELFARKLPGLLAWIAKDGPALLVVLFASPFKARSGAGEEEMGDYKRKIHATFDTLSIPIGLGAAAAALFVVLLVWVN
jgi:multicomponent Na+:H+ antiporter subunit D